MSLAKLHRRVDYWRGLREKGLEPPPVAEVSIEDAEALCDLADVVRWLRDRHWEGDAGCDACRQVWPCETRRSLDAALARLDGETDG